MNLLTELESRRIDSLLSQAQQLFAVHGRLSRSFLMRKLKISHLKAMQLINEIEKDV